MTPRTPDFTDPSVAAFTSAEPIARTEISGRVTLIEGGAAWQPGHEQHDMDGPHEPPPVVDPEQDQDAASSGQTFARSLSDAGAQQRWRPLGRRVRLATGEQILGTRYRLVRWLGAGGMGDVFEAIHVDIERRVALKFLKPGADEDTLAHFMAEARMIAKIDSRFVVDVLDFGELPDGRPFYAMELLDDNSLHTLLGAGPVPLQRALPILRQCCKALVAVHEAGMAHRDLKPQNILLQIDEGRADMVRLVDFGISSEFGACEARVAGTPSYMAPEQILGGSFDGRLDIYALGCLACEMLSGEPPFSGHTMVVFNQHLDATPDSLTGRRPELPKQIDEVIARCLAKAPEDRWANAAELEAALCEVQIAAGFTTAWDDLALPDIDPVRREGLATRMPRPRKRSTRQRRILLAAGLVSAFVAGASFVWSSSMIDHAPREAVDSSWVEDYATQARAAAAQAYWVYPPAAEPDAMTARGWVVALEERAGFMNFSALAQADSLRAEFSATLTRLGDLYWEQEHGRAFAVEYYAQALMFEGDNPRAQERVALTPAQLADVGARASRGEFSNAELEAGAMLAALAEGDEQQRRDRVVDLLQHERATRAVQTVDGLVNLVGAQEFAAEVADATGGRRRHGSGAGNTDPVHAQQLAEQGRKLLDKGSRSRAERMFHKAITLDPRNFDAISGFAQLHFDRGNYGKSLSYVKNAATLRPHDADVRLLLGDVYLKTLRYADARAAYKKARSLGHPLAAKRLTHLAQLTR